MENLKSGDKLICIDQKYGIILGQKYTFKSYCYNGDYDEKYRLIRIFENDYEYFKKRFIKIDNKTSHFILMSGEFKLEGYFNSVDECLKYISIFEISHGEIYKKVANVKTETNVVVEEV